MSQEKERSMKQISDFTGLRINAFHNQRSGLLTALFTVLFTLLLVSSANSQTSSYAGQYKGEWTAKPAGMGSFTDGEDEHNGTWDISIESDGEITGTCTDDTSDSKCTVKGFIDEKGRVNVSVKYKTTSKVKGVFEKKGIRLIGSLKQFCGEYNELCASIEMILKRK
jgi:hypothetical protein